MRTTLEGIKTRLDRAQDYILEAIDALSFENDDDIEELSELLDEINELINQVLDY